MSDFGIFGSIFKTAASWVFLFVCLFVFVLFGFFFFGGGGGVGVFFTVI